jgi:helicase
MMGRAGRPQYDKYGEALLLAKSTYERERLWENYLERETEDIESKLDSDSALRTHILGAIASKVAEDNESLRKFLSKTFFVYQKVKSPLELQNIIKPILEFLQENQLIKEYKERLLATRFGKRVAELYIDPISGIILRDALRSVNKLVPTEFSYLHAIASTPDMPLLYPRRKDDDWLEEKLELCRQELLVKDENYEWSLAHLKTASMLEDWVTEHTEEYISKKYDLGPGDIHAKTETSEWLLYSFRELAKLFNPKVISKLGKLILRVRYGVKEELLELVALRGIGRVRARALFRAGLRDLKTLRIATLEKIASVEKIGLALAKSIKQQLS